MARIPYYQDPVFLQKAAQRLPMGQSFSSPFSATTRNVGMALSTRRNQELQAQMGTANAQAGRMAAGFGYNQAWQGWQGNVNRSARNIQAQEQMAYQRRMEEARRRAARKSRRRGLLGAGLGAGGGILGAVIGNMVLPGVGGVIGSQLGSAAGSNIQ